MCPSVQFGSHLVVRRIVSGLDDLTVDGGHRKDLLAIRCNKFVDVCIVAELERHLVDGIPFDSDAGLFRLKTPQVLVETHQAFINRWSTQPSRATHSWFIAVSYTHLRAHETRHDLVCRLLLEKKKKKTRNKKKKHKKKYQKNKKKTTKQNR